MSQASYTDSFYGDYFYYNNINMEDEIQLEERKASFEKSNPNFFC